MMISWWVQSYILIGVLITGISAGLSIARGRVRYHELLRKERKWESIREHWRKHYPPGSRTEMSTGHLSTLLDRTTSLDRDVEG